MQVEAIKWHLAHLNTSLDRLSQRAKAGSTEIMLHNEGTWLMLSPLSHNMLGAMMKRLSSEAALSMTYSNHCVPVTVISKLKRAGVEDRNICDVSGHKNVQSLRSYIRTTAEEIKMMADAIDGKVANKTTAHSSPKDRRRWFIIVKAQQLWNWYRWYTQRFCMTYSH